jgi:hypothetical protein
MQVTVSQYVDIDIDLDDISANDLAKALVNKKNYQAALDKALHGDSSIILHDDADEIRELVEAFRCHKPIEPLIASIAYSKYGLVC